VINATRIGEAGRRGARRGECAVPGKEGGSAGGRRWRRQVGPSLK